jgi:cyclopropane-fatty-acyl-phospholipid synthase
LATVYGSTDARRWLNRWRMFFLAVSELFGYADGDEWFVSHYLMEHRAAS